MGDADGVLVVDETGFLKKGTQSVGWRGNIRAPPGCQVGVFAAYASWYGHALVDRRLYLPKAWAEDEAWRAKAHIPNEVRFTTAEILRLVARLILRRARQIEFIVA